MGVDAGVMRVREGVDKGVREGLLRAEVALRGATLCLVTPLY